MTTQGIHVFFPVYPFEQKTENKITPKHSSDRRSSPATPTSHPRKQCQYRTRDILATRAAFVPNSFRAPWHSTSRWRLPRLR